MICGSLNFNENYDQYYFLLPPATKLGQGYIFTGVCDSVNGGGGVCSGGFLLPGGCLLRGGGVRSGGVSAPGGVSVRGGVPGGDPPGTATAAGDTHPTGMHFC